jgi:hypothetical protein
MGRCPSRRPTYDDRDVSISHESRPGVTVAEDNRVRWNTLQQARSRFPLEGRDKGTPGESRGRKATRLPRRAQASPCRSGCRMDLRLGTA